MELQNVLSDQDQFPTESLIFSHIGESRVLWEKLFGSIDEDYPEITEEWRFYSDGKRWLLKVIKKKKTIFWLSVATGAFNITFYFGDKAEPLIMGSEISDTHKQAFKTGKRYGKIRGITIEVSDTEDLDNIFHLIDLRLSLK